MQFNMAILELDVREFCPLAAVTLYLDTARENVNFMPCGTGGNFPRVELRGDRMIEEIGKIRVSCKGCALAPAFEKVVKRKIA